MAKSSDPSDFSPTTKRELADRAGHHCSRCLALTTCSDEQGKPFRIGDAAHQAAASEQGPRYDPDQTDTERSSVENGLWLCSSCHRKIDGDRYRYSVQDLKQMKAEAEERARKMVHGEIVFEMKNKEAAAIEHYLSSRPLTNFLPKSSPIADDPLLANGAKLGIQIIPYRAVFEVPRLNYPELIKNGVPRSELVIHPSPTPDNKGVFVVDGREVSRIDKDATAELFGRFRTTSSIRSLRQPHSSVRVWREDRFCPARDSRRENHCQDPTGECSRQVAGLRRFGIVLTSHSISHFEN